MKRFAGIALLSLAAVAVMLALIVSFDRTASGTLAPALPAVDAARALAPRTAFSWRAPLTNAIVESQLDATPPHLRATPTPIVRARLPAPGAQSLPDLPVDQLIALNRDRALAGDAQAAYQIGAALWQCQRLPVRQRDLARGKPANDTVGLYEQSIQSAARWLDRCQNIGVVALSQTLPWIELAAQNGSIEAMLLYGTAAIGELTPEEMLADPIALIQRKERSMQYLFAAVNHGSTSTLSDIAHIYRTGTLVKPDPVLACAYEIAYFDTGPQTPYARPMLDFFSKDLSDEERKRAQELADRIRRACCG